MNSLLRLLVAPTFWWRFTLAVGYYYYYWVTITTWRPASVFTMWCDAIWWFISFVQFYSSSLYRLFFELDSD